ncbi:MAG: GTP pyrophosphokinase family protein [Christensenellales bacterium]
MREIQGVALVANEDTILRQFSEEKQRLMDFQDDLEDIIPTLLSANGIEVANISFRIKNEDSLRKKIQFKRKYQQLTDVTDLIGCRIVTLFEPDMERVLEVLSREFEMIELVDKRKKSLEGYIDFGYNSIHVILRFSDARCQLVEYQRYRDIKFEVQIRTALQHAWGEIEHGLGYKSNFEIPLSIRRKLTRIAATLELIDEEFEVIRQEVAQYNQSFDRIEKVLKTDINKNTLIQYFETSGRTQQFTSQANPYGLEVSRTMRLSAGWKFVQRLQFWAPPYPRADAFIEENLEGLKALAEKWIEKARPKVINEYSMLVYVILLASAKDAAEMNQEEGPIQGLQKAIENIQ